MFAYFCITSQVEPRDKSRLGVEFLRSQTLCVDLRVYVLDVFAKWGKQLVGKKLQELIVKKIAKINIETITYSSGRQNTPQNRFSEVSKLFYA